MGRDIRRFLCTAGALTLFLCSPAYAHLWSLFDLIPRFENLPYTPEDSLRWEKRRRETYRGSKCETPAGCRHYDTLRSMTKPEATMSEAPASLTPSRSSEKSFPPRRDA